MAEGSPAKPITRYAQLFVEGVREAELPGIVAGTYLGGGETGYLVAKIVPTRH